MTSDAKTFLLHLFLDIIIVFNSDDFVISVKTCRETKHEIQHPPVPHLLGIYGKVSGKSEVGGRKTRKKKTGNIVQYSATAKAEGAQEPPRYGAKTRH